MADNNEDEMGRRGIRWDEETIAEHDKLRGTRQKIDEPPTPYHVSYEPADAEDHNMDIGAAGEGGGGGGGAGRGGSYSAGSISSSHRNDNGSTPLAQHRVSRSGSVCSAPGTPSDAAKKSQPGYLAENWQVLTTALEQAAKNREALISRSSSSSSSGSGGGGGGGGGGESFSPSMSRSGSGSGGRRERATSFSSDSEIERMTEEKRIKSPQHKAFTQKRLSHYDEYKKLQEWKQAHQDEDEEEEGEGQEGEEEDGGEGMGDGSGGSSSGSGGGMKSS